ncbi:MAG: hypothetical protein OYL97_02245 [Candidatus Poribacteria bacterium]|nr:hypothetical protein [Candidatus Poribacteria bacterium]
MEKKRGSLFTVRDAESAIITYTVLGLLYIIGICLYELVVGWNGVLQMLRKLDATSPVFNRVAIAFIIFKEGVDIMLRRFNEWRAEHAQSLEKAKEQGIEQGIEQGRAEVYEVIAAWNKRRLAAEAKGIPFNEPPPSQNGHQHG